MPRAGNTPRRCKDCKRRPPECGNLSARALCADCAIARQTKSAVQQVAQQGEYYDRWREAMRRAGNRY